MIPFRPILCAGAVAALVCSGASAQDPGGQRLTGTLSQDFTADTNFGLEDPDEGTSYRSTTTLGIGFRDETRTQVFSLDSDISLRALRDGDGDTELEASLPSVALRYSQDAARARFEVGARYRQESLAFIRALEVDTDDDGGISVPDPEDFDRVGDRATYGADAQLTFGIDTPVEVTLRAEADITDYSDVTDPDLNDSETFTLGASATFRVSPVVDATLSLTGTAFSEDDPDQTERDQLTLRAGLAYTVNERLSYSAGAQVTHEEETTTAGSTDDVTYGVDVGVAYALETTRFDGTIGLETTDDDDTVVTASLSFGLDLPRGASLTGGLDRSLTFGTGGDDLAVTGARIDYVRPINNISSASLGLSYSLTEDLEAGGDPDETRVTLSAGYERAITENLDLSLGYAYRLRDEGAEEADSHSVTLGLSMPFSF